MTLDVDLREAARALQEAAAGLAAALRIAAQRRHAAASVVETFREADSLALTTVAVMDAAGPMLRLLAPHAPVVGRAPPVGHPNARVRNGFDSLGLTLLILLRKASDAVSDVAANQSQWVISPLQAKQCIDAMKIHHGQLKAIYGLLHLVQKIIDNVDVSKRLFLDVHGDRPRPDLEPREWRSAIRVEPLFGRFFGFHYGREMRQVLRVANIARGSITSAAATTPESTSPLVRNIAALGWGWVYSNMTLLNNMGVTIDGASEIGKDADGADVTVEMVRAFMNLAEEPIVSGVTALASPDVSINLVFNVLPRELVDGSADSATTLESGGILDVPLPSSPVAMRLLSALPRPIDKRALLRGEALDSSPRLGSSGNGLSRTASERDKDSLASPRNSVFNKDVPLPVDIRNRGLLEAVDDDGEPQKMEMNEFLCHDRLRVVQTTRGMAPSLSSCGHSSVSVSGDSCSAVVERNSTKSLPNSSNDVMTRATSAIQQSLTDVAESSLLASALKNEIVRFHSNVSSFLTPEAPELASALIINFHGGGFVSQSSAGHVVYLKEWASDLQDSVMLCIDYKLAPENPYPVALNECVLAYQWALRNAERIGTRARKVVLCGDSAGGNLAVAAAMKLQQLGLHRPNGVCVGYPALYVNVAWSPSRLLSFFDPLLPLSILEFCLRGYVPPGERPHANPLISPIAASAEILRELPPMAIVSGSLDPLLDDTVQFGHNLRSCGRDCDKILIAESLPHGFLNMCQVSKDARGALRFLSRNMGDMLGIPLRGERAAGASDGSPESSGP